MVGSAYAYGKKKHLAVVFVARKIPEKYQIVVRLLVEAVVMVFIVVILLFGGTKAYQNAGGQISSAIGMPIEYLYLSLIVSGVLFLFYLVLHVKEYFTKTKPTSQ
jgi:TRAP-type C4-dicarboxylate transport system permease small subunit